MSDFCASLWPEEPTPENHKHCSDCGLDQHGTRMVWGEGNPAAPILVLLDNPGAREDRENQPFVCGTRQTLQQAAYEVGLTTKDLYVTYILKRRPIRAYDKERTREICMNHLYQQLKTKHPKLILCLGNIAVQSFFQNPDTDVKTLRGQIHNVQGYNTTTAYHPLAVRRRPNLWPLFLDDWKLAAEFVEKSQ
ncbi:uracil-DNA glycosylase [Mesobacillus maritimus]|uniref:uracil-DNA glycosylase n=1 Tax=Mesobacillus maritimus TaxID=1643336 RepID=UPI00203DE660|nr:uracil-DNA glycosylase [Mesobacillus maritimus]MCM3585446.1 uracil-DNA glycosylase [Mesobacillus maritimus]MCM3669705.1 uracil-DNA glycosylase [Mesobacillus maritimus]